MSGYNNYYQLISTLVTILDMDGNDKLNHGLRVGIIAGKLAQMVMPNEANIVYYAGLLHDVGGVGLEDNIVHYGLENDYSETRVRNHPLLGGEIVGSLPGLEKAACYVAEHHERWDGTGLPRGLQGKEISLGGQIIGIADQMDLRIRESNGDRTSIYNYFRLQKGKMFSEKLWPYILDLIGTNNNNFFYQLIDDHHLYSLASGLEEDLLPLKINYASGDYILQAVKVLARVIDAKHPYTRGHSWRVAEYAAVLAKHLALNPKEIRDIKLAGYLHDLGKIAVPLRVLDKTSDLSDEEYQLIKGHVLIGRELLEYEPSLRHLAPTAGTHHEKWDGSGYPDGLKGEEIPLGGRILALADSLDALSSKRSYNQPVSMEEACGILRKARGKHFDPQVVDLLQKNEVIQELKAAKEKGFY